MESLLGVSVGNAVGSLVGIPVGTLVRSQVGISVGTPVGSPGSSHPTMLCGDCFWDVSLVGRSDGLVQG